MSKLYFQKPRAAFGVAFLKRFYSRKPRAAFINIFLPKDAKAARGFSRKIVIFTKNYDLFWEHFSWLDLFSPDRWFAALWLVSASNCFGDRAVTGGSLVVVADAWSNLESALAPPPNVIQMDRAPVLPRPFKFHAQFGVLMRGVELVRSR